MPTYTHLNLYATPQLQAALQAVYEAMKHEGIPCDYGGKMNASAVILYALQRARKEMYQVADHPPPLQIDIDRY